MAGPLIVGAEGVLLVPDQESYAASRPITEGIELTMQLGHFPTSNTVVLVSTVDTEVGMYFCRMHGLSKSTVVGIAPEDKTIEAPTAQWFAIERLRAKGPINMILTAYALVYERCRRSHQPVILFGRRGSLAGLEGQSTWDELHKRALNHREAMAEEALKEV
jgi:hypothetical protein